MFRAIYRVSILGLAMAFLSACGPGASDEGVQVVSDIATPGDASTLRLVSAVPVVYDGNGAPWTKELLSETEFASFNVEKAKESLWSGLGWHIAPAEVAAPAVTLTKSADSGANVLSIAKAATEIYIQQSTLELPQMPADTWVVANARVKASVPGEVGIVSSLKTAQGNWKVGEANVAGGGWQDLALAFPIPAGSPAQSFVLELYRRPLSETPVEIQSASVRLSPGVPNGALSPIQPGSLILNGGFELFAFPSVPYPWFVDSWNSKGGKAERVDVRVVPIQGSATGKNCILFEPAGENCVVRISQEVPGLTGAMLGKKLVARAKAVAGHSQDFWLHFRATNNGKEDTRVVASANHPGDSQWHEVMTEVILPTDKLPEVVYVGAFRRANSGAAVMVDDIVVTVE